LSFNFCIFKYIVLESHIALNVLRCLKKGKWHLWFTFLAIGLGQEDTVLWNNDLAQHYMLLTLATTQDNVESFECIILILRD
jgi:hypothetical protein